MSDARKESRRLAAVLIALTVAAYSNTYDVPFRFDDPGSIANNASIRALWPPWGIFTPPPAVTVTGRPVANASFALNHAISGLEPWSYHAGNLAVHLLAGLLLFGIVRRTPTGRDARVATRGAFAAATIWLLHPLQTESVTYVVQRVESLCGLFYLLTIYGCVRAWANPAGRTGWQSVGVIACALGMATKEVMVTAPLVVLLYDRTFLAGTFRAAWTARRGFYLSLAGTWFLLGLLVASSEARAGTAGFGTAISSWNYALTQFEAVLRYLARALWPDGLIFDYGADVVRDPRDVVVEGCAVALLLGGTAWALARTGDDPAAKRWRMAGFLGAAFFLILAPTSTILPIATQTVAEHRMYLPLASIAVGMAWVIARARHGTLVAGAVGGALALLTWQRNEVYRDDFRLWSDTAVKRPNNERAHYNTAVALVRANRLAESVASYQRAVHLAPGYVEARHNLGIVLAKLGRVDEALRHLVEAARLAPGDAAMRNVIGFVLVQAGRPHEAVAHHRAALQLQPGYALAHAGLAGALAQAGRVTEALPQFEAALRADPGDAETLGAFGVALLQAGQTTAAIGRFEQALALNPNLVAVRSRLGAALLQQGEAARAVPHFQIAARQQPEDPASRYQHAQALIVLRRWGEAEAALIEALRLRPDFVEAQRQLELVRQSRR